MTDSIVARVALTDDEWFAIMCSLESFSDSAHEHGQVMVDSVNSAYAKLKRERK